MFSIVKSSCVSANLINFSHVFLHVQQMWYMRRFVFILSCLRQKRNTCRLLPPNPPFELIALEDCGSQVDFSPAVDVGIDVEPS